MQFISTRGATAPSAAHAIIKGICPAGGLFVPKDFSQVAADTLLAYADDYPALAYQIMQPYLSFKETALKDMLKQAYSTQFDTPSIVRLRTLSRREGVMELWHGPTLAFKDMALQMLPHLMKYSLAETGETKKIYILVATSGDTGKAALAGFSDVPGTALQVFYPDGGVSHTQWLQMVTQQGANVFVSGVKGNFDDAQTAVKRIFADAAINRQISALGYRLSSANSINFGRLLPQIVYYYAAFLRACKQNIIQPGEKINFCVPTGNFGNILAGYYAKRMGLPVNKLICASNRNNVLTDFFQSGKYDSNRPFYRSMSCSIDILVSSNLERLLFELTGRDNLQVSDWMNSLTQTGSYTIDEALTNKLHAYFYADWCNEDDTLATIRAEFDKSGYLMDPHTAVAQTIYHRYRETTGDETYTVLLSTAHPFKFSSGVLRAFETPCNHDDENNARLASITGHPVPPVIASLAQMPILHKKIVAIGDTPARVLEVLRP